MEQIAAERAHLIACARQWLGTPYHHQARLRGKEGGADCLTFLAGAFEDAGLIPRLTIPAYSPQWHLHRSEELYLQGVLDFCDEVGAPPARAPLPGDVVLFKFGRCFAHGAIVIDWPMVQHSYQRLPNCRADAERDAWLHRISERAPERGKLRPRRFFCLRRWLTAES